METSAATPLLAGPAKAAAVDDDPSREIRHGLIVLGGFAALIFGWSALTPRLPDPDARGGAEPCPSRCKGARF